MKGPQPRPQFGYHVGSDQRVPAEIKEKIVFDGYRSELKLLLPDFYDRALEIGCRWDNLPGSAAKKRAWKRQLFPIHLSTYHRRQFVQNVQIPRHHVFRKTAAQQLRDAGVA